jgi:hypothetical protein
MRINENMQLRLRAMLAPNGGSAGSGSGNTDDQIIDVTTIPDEKLNELLHSPDEEKIRKELTGGGTEKTEEGKEGKEKAGDGKGETEEQKTAREALEAERANETPEAKAAREAAEAAAAGNKDEKLLAGKYKTKEELFKGFVNIAKPLNYNPKLLDAMVKLAEKTGDVSDIEELYKELELAVSNNAKATAPGAQQPPATPKPGTSERSERDTSALPTTMEDATRQEATRLTLVGAIEELRGSRIVQRMEKNGINLPPTFLIDQKETAEFLAGIEKEFPWLYDQLENETVALVNKHAKHINAVMSAMQEATVENPKKRESEIAKIKAEALAIKLPVKDEELAVFVDEALKQPWVYEDREGIQFIREGAIMDAWYLKNRDSIKKQLQLNGEVTGRTQAVSDLNTNKGKSTASISSSRIPSDQAGRRDKAGSIDLENPEVTAQLSDEQLDDLIKHPEKREKLQPK